jgi:hypothetical protein
MFPVGKKKTQSRPAPKSSVFHIRVKVMLDPRSLVLLHKIKMPVDWKSAERTACRLMMKRSRTNDSVCFGPENFALCDGKLNGNYFDVKYSRHEVLNDPVMVITSEEQLKKLQDTEGFFVVVTHKGYMYRTRKRSIDGIRTQRLMRWA